jgi:O-methyltransferase
VPEDNSPHPSKVLDLEMLASPGGVERTEQEYHDLYQAAGFRLSRIVPTRSPFSVIEGVKA